MTDSVKTSVQEKDEPLFLKCLNAATLKDFLEDVERGDKPKDEKYFEGKQKLKQLEEELKQIKKSCTA